MASEAAPEPNPLAAFPGPEAGAGPVPPLSLNITASASGDEADDGAVPSDKSSVALVVAGALVLAFFLWTRASRRRKYQQIPADAGWAGSVDA